MIIQYVRDNILLLNRVLPLPRQLVLLPIPDLQYACAHAPGPLPGVSQPLSPLSTPPNHAMIAIDMTWHESDNSQS